MTFGWKMNAKKAVRIAQKFCAVPVIHPFNYCNSNSFQESARDPQWRSMVMSFPYMLCSAMLASLATSQL